MSSEMLTMTSEANIVWDTLILNVRKEENEIREFLNQNGIQDSSPQELINAFTLDIVRNKFFSQWKFETDTRWKGRSFNMAFYETVFHTTSAILGEIELFLDKDRSPLFSEWNRTDVERLQTHLDLMSQYLQTKIPSR